MKHITWATLVCSSLFTLALGSICTAANAEPVQRWQDAQGQWHYGDGAASNTLRTQTVNIKTPISVVRNDHPLQRIDSEKASIARSPRIKATQHKKPSQSDQHKIYCKDMQAKIHQTELSTDDLAQRQILLNTYEQQCIHGHYYGNSDDR